MVDPRSRIGRALRWIGRRDWARLVLGPKVLTRVDAVLHRLTRGRVVASDLLFDTLVLTTTGRRSGRPRRSTLARLDLDGTPVVIASNFGRQPHPAWSHNLLANPAATIEVGGRPRSVTARLLTPPERDRVWPQAVALWPGYETYRQATDGVREIRMFALEPRGAPTRRDRPRDVRASTTSLHGPSGETATGEACMDEDVPTAGPWDSTAALVAWAAETHGDAPALQAEDGTTWTFRDLDREVVRVARGLLATGIAPGDRVGIWAPNVATWVFAALGVHAVGGVLVPLNTRYRGREAAYILRRSRARLLLTISGFLDTDYPALLRDGAGGPGPDRPVADLPDLAEVVVLPGDVPEGTTGWEDLLARGRDVDEDDARARAAAVRPDDLSDIMFTSGTTGNPKGVRCTHEQTLRTFEIWSRIVGLAAGDRYLVVNPFFHTFGYKAGIVAALMRGATILPHAVFDAEQVLRRVPEDRISMLPGPPAIYQTILEHPDRDQLDLSSLRLAVTGAASIPVSLIRRMHDELGFRTVLTAYGLTEATGTVTMCRDGDDPETIATTSGRAIPGVEVRVVDDDGVEVPRGERGEVVVRGFNVMQGYLDDPEETARAIDPDGWLHTGDVGVMDEAGYLDIVDRTKDMFIVGGFNAYPAEIENLLVEHPDVAQAAVVGVADERLGEVGCAFVVPATGATVEPDDLVAWSRAEMANFKVPRRVEVVDELPRNPSGKVLKHELRARVT